ncbi:hypothetical protein D5R93_02330 [Actinomyces lilanjuaniae]|uniref:Lipoprotein n=1 Tax=Actinomyces lilanjuaniae TaxID=2321394 RepID=A0ABN5PLH2_9ACTO|nr:hypothetical protein [Actinomyces lilanjuaniae]AYD89185.1 hypothetical protein D5R93_02330 [Actinomyces lilanjuaniae]
MRTLPTLTTLVLALTTLAACTTPTSQTTTQQPTRETTPQQHATSPCLSEDSSHAPGGYCLYPAKVTWPTDVLPVDPATLDWSDPDAVARAYTVTVHTWDSRHDASGAYATRRAQIFTQTGRTAPDTTDPDTTRGDAEYTTTWQQDSYTDVTIDALGTESPHGRPLQADGTWRRTVTYTRTVRTRTDGAAAYQRQGTLFLTLATDPATGQWLVTTATPTSERDTEATPADPS